MSRWASLVLKRDCTKNPQTRGGKIRIEPLHGNRRVEQVRRVYEKESARGQKPEV